MAKTSEANDEITSAVLARVQEHEDQASTFLSQFVKNDQLYRSVPEPLSGEDNEGKANTFVMETFRDVETDVAALYDYLFADGPWFEVIPESSQQKDVDRALNTQGLLEKQISSMKFSGYMTRSLRSMLVHGTAIVGTPWKYKTRWQGDAAGYSRRPLMDMPGFDPINILRFHVDPYAQDIEDASWICFEAEMSKRDLQALITAAEKAGAKVKNLDAIDWKAAKGSDSASAQAARTMRQSRGWVDQGPSRVKVLDFCGDHPTRNENLPPYRCVIVQDSDCVIEMPTIYHHGFKPALRAPFIELDESFYGIGLGQVLQRSQSELNGRTNLAFDMLKFALYGPFQSDSPGTGNREKKLKMRQFKILPRSEFGNLSAVVPPGMLSVLQYVLQWNQHTKEDMRGASAATNDQQAIAADTTAKEAGIVNASSSRRLSVYGRLVAENLVTPWLTRAAMLNAQYVSPKTAIEVLGQKGREWREINKGDIISEPRFRLRDGGVNESVNKRIRNLNSTLGMYFQGIQASPEMAKQLTEQIDVVGMFVWLLQLYGTDYRDVVASGRRVLGPKAGKMLTPETMMPEINDLVEKKIAEALVKSGVLPSDPAAMPAPGAGQPAPAAPAAPPVAPAAPVVVG